MTEDDMSQWVEVVGGGSHRLYHKHLMALEKANIPHTLPLPYVPDSHSKNFWNTKKFTVDIPPQFVAMARTFGFTLRKARKE